MGASQNDSLGSIHNVNKMKNWIKGTISSKFQPNMRISIATTNKIKASGKPNIDWRSYDYMECNKGCHSLRLGLTKHKVKNSEVCCKEGKTKNMDGKRIERNW